MVKIRLQRHGRKRRAFYYIVAADVRAPRDGRYIERIGSYNPNTNPATIDLDLDASVRWLQNGAVPTDTCRAILSYKGAMYKNHLLKGVHKGAFDEAEADKKFATWMEDKTGRISSKEEKLAKEAADAAEAAFKREEEVRIAREKAIAAKNSPLTEEVVEETAAETTEASSEDAAAEETAPVAEEKAAEAKTEETAPVAEEAPKAEEKAEETAPVAEEKTEEAPKAEASEETAEKVEEPKAEAPAETEKTEESSETAEEQK